MSGKKKPKKTASEIGGMHAAVRDIGTLAWTDPLAWTEPMKGDRWKRLLSREKRLFQSVLGTLPPTEIPALTAELSVAAQAEDVPFQTLGLSITGSGHTRFWSDAAAVPTECVDVVCDSHHAVWDIADVGEGAETYAVRYWPSPPHSPRRPLWSITGVGPTVVVLGSLCFFLRARNRLWYSELVCVNAYTGKSLRVLYTETDPQWNLSLVRCENHTAYCVRENSGLQEVFTLTATGTLHPLNAPAGFFVLGGGPHFFATAGRGTDSWKPYGPTLTKWRLPTWRQHGIPEAVVVSRGLLITRKQGERILWKCTPTHPPQRQVSVLGELHFHTENAFHMETTLQIRIVEPGQFSQILTITDNSVQESVPVLPPYGETVRFFTTTHVPYLLVRPLTTATAAAHHLLVIGYGAYGLPTSLNTTRWLPLLSRGWAIAFALVRGGGDDTYEWADAARCWRRENAIRDFVDVIRAAQAKTHISPQATCIYGRSAGGILIGAAAAASDRPFRCVYGEVPYLDVLRTTTHPDLPLTRLEYDEFGNPARLEDLMAIVRFSPMEAVPPEGYPDCWILIRTGENDSEVFAYESVKWILRTRGTKQYTDTTKVLAFEEGEGHFGKGDRLAATRATDLAILLAHA